MVPVGGTDPKLTKMGNPVTGFPANDPYSGRVIAAYGVATLGRTGRWRSGPAASLDKLGAKMAIDQGYAGGP